MESKIEGLIKEGWKPRIKKKKNRRYITLRKGNEERSFGPYTDELWEKVKPADLSAILSHVLDLERRINELERAMAKPRKIKRRKRQFKRKLNQEQPESSTIDLQIHTLMKSQGTHSRKNAISRAIETQDAFNPNIINHGLKTPKELMTFFEEKIKKKDERIEWSQANADRYLAKLIESQLTNA